ncbi:MULTISPECIES: hypothetical protein [unclassified Sphingobacterium]|uniref:hypothetical protein n=1 Tax=unclassified Sphingobacterium TaxID=2609468 RepID=UPI0025E1A9A6|nr:MULTISPECIES: hypothetical protein [unclassified Sphingobacterium]
MKKFYFFFILSIFSQKLFSQNDSRIENIGKLTSELLINKNNIENFKYAIKLKNLYPDEDFSKFEDSPAEVILRMLYGAELELPHTWNNLLQESNRFKIDNKSVYINTYYYTMSNDSHIVSSVIKSQDKFYLFSYNLLEWDKDIYISKFYKELKEFKNIQDIELNPFIIIDNELQKEMNEFNDITTLEEIIITNN